jgi:hypothetical protein
LKPRTRVVIALAAAVVCSRGAIAQTGPGAIEIGGYAQVTRVAPEQARFESRTPLSLGLRGRVNLHRRVGLELEASTSTVEGADVGTARRYNQLVARATITRPVSDFSGLLLGAGLARSDYEITYNFGPSVLLGVQTLLRGRYALRSDAIFNYLPTSGATEFGLRTGLQTTLGPFDGPTSRDRRGGNRTVQAPGSVEGVLFVQQWRLNPRWNLESGRAIGARVGAFVTSRSEFEVDVTYGRQARPSAATGGAATTFRVTTFAARYAHNIPIGTRLGVVGALGPVRSSYEFVDYWGASAAAGARLALTRDIQLRADGVANYLRVPQVFDFGARIGISALLRLGTDP